MSSSLRHAHPAMHNQSSRRFITSFVSSFPRFLLLLHLLLLLLRRRSFPYLAHLTTYSCFLFFALLLFVINNQSSHAHHAHQPALVASHHRTTRLDSTRLDSPTTYYTYCTYLLSVATNLMLLDAFEHSCRSWFPNPISRHLPPPPP